MRVLPSFKKSLYSLGTIVFLGFLCTLSVQAEENEGSILIPPSDSVESVEIVEVEDDTTSTKPTDNPVIHDVQVSGEVDTTKKGMEAFDSISIEVTGQNITDDHVLTKEGIRFSEKSEIQVIKGKRLEKVKHDEFKENTPVYLYSANPGDKGRITYVAKTRSGIDLDLLWTIRSNDVKEWKKYNPDKKLTQGVIFTGEQSYKNSKGDSISVLPVGMTMLDIVYQIVKHNTYQEMPVLVSFITSDIDGRQGIQTNLDNLARILPKNTNIKEKDGVIYDTKGIGVEGSQHLPQGGYMGAGFISKFQYIFYVPAPAYENGFTATITRYDLFGSALQAKGFKINRVQHLTVEYVDRKGNTIRKKEKKLSLSSAYNLVNVPKINTYQWNSYKLNTNNPNYPVLTLVYDKTYTITFKFQDSNGKTLQESKTYTRIENSKIDYTPSEIEGYITPKKYSSTLLRNIVHLFIYKRLPEYSLTDGNQQNNYSPFLNQNNYEPIMSVQSKEEVDSDKPKDKFDWISENMGLTKEDYETFFKYIHLVESKALKDGKSQDEANEIVLTAIASVGYEDDWKEGLVHNFTLYKDYYVIDDTKKHKKLCEDAREIIKQNHDNSNISDLSHTAMELSTTYFNSRTPLRTLLKGLITGIPQEGELPKLFMDARTKMLYYNSFYADSYTTNGPDDENANRDGWMIFDRMKNSPVESIVSIMEDHYSTQYLRENQDKKFKKIYGIYPNELTDLNGSYASIAAFSVLGGYFAIKYASKRKEQKKQKEKSLADKVNTSIKQSKINPIIRLVKKINKKITEEKHKVLSKSHINSVKKIASKIKTGLSKVKKKKGINKKVNNKQTLKKQNNKKKLNTAKTVIYKVSAKTTGYKIKQSMNTISKKANQLVRSITNQVKKSLKKTSVIFNKSAKSIKRSVTGFVTRVSKAVGKLSKKIRRKR